MVIKKLSTNQIMTLSDFPVHNEQVLKLYHRMYWKGASLLVPPLPVVIIDKGQLELAGDSKEILQYNALLKKFLTKHPEVKYCFVDGSHKSTAAALCGKKIASMILTTDEDIKKARIMVEAGELFSLTTGGTNSIEDAIDILRKNFLKAMLFETVAEKTARMVRANVVPKYMIKIYKTLKKV